MGGERETPDTTATQRGHALVKDKRETGGGRGRGAAGPPGLLALQRSAGNAAVNALLAGGSRSSDGVAATDSELAQREVGRDEPMIESSAGNASVGRLLAGPVLQRAEITPESIGKALDKVTVESAKTRAVASLRPWVIFETLPWNPSDGNKSRLFSQLRKAFTAQTKAEAALADAKKREAVATAAGGKATPAAHPTAAAKRKGKGRKAKVLPTVAEA